MEIDQISTECFSAIIERSFPSNYIIARRHVLLLLSMCEREENKEKETDRKKREEKRRRKNPGQDKSIDGRLFSRSQKHTDAENDSI